MLHRLALSSALALVLTIAACKRTPPPPAKEPEIGRIAIVGHGYAFDAGMQAIPMDLKTIRSMQESLREVLAGAKLADNDRTRAFAAKIEAAMARTKSEEERALLAGALLNYRVERADKRVRETYGWRNRYLAERVRGLYDRRFAGQAVIHESVLRLLREGGLIIDPVFDTAYMDDCRAQSVPVPPNFSIATPGEWVHQGSLAFNILGGKETDTPPDPADVWTWTDPDRRGACIALPRDNGGIGSLTGIICQSATTGNACFWDNLTRADRTRRIPSATETMVIRELQDGRTLDEGPACTRCHTGNNVFLISPDDPTWSKVLKGLDGPHPDPPTFTTLVETQTSPLSGPRYTPIAHASWVNPPLAAGCSGSCHAAPSDMLQTRFYRVHRARRNVMPAPCATGGDYRNCYGTP